jgi:hypothetical protein
MLDQEKLRAFLAVRRSQENIALGFLGGFIGALLGALLWGAVTALFQGWQIGYMAIGVGFLVSFGVRTFGRGIEQIFGYMGAVLSLLGCVAGNVLGDLITTSIQDHTPFADLLASTTPAHAWEILTQHFSIFSLVFYGIAIYYGYHNSFQKITPEELQALQVQEPDPPAAAPL